MKNVDKLSMAAMKSAAAELGIKLPAGDPKAAAEILRRHFNENYEPESLAACGVCGYEAHEDLTSCPYCGTDLGGAEEPKPVKKPKTKKPAPAKKGGKKKAVEEDDEESTEIAKPDPKVVEEMNKRVNRIKELRRDLVKNSYYIGKELREINEKQLFKSMGHRSFVEFCKRELEYSRVMAYKYMSLCAFSEDDAILLGPTKADIIVNAGSPDKAGELNRKQKKLLEMARSGASRTDMEKELKKGQVKNDKDDSITLVGRVRDKEVFMAWISTKTGKPANREIKNKYAELEIVSGIFITVTESAKGDGLVFAFRKGAAQPEPEPEPTEEDSDD